MVINVQRIENMKKIYINPTIEIVKIQTMQMLAASENISFGDSVDSAVGAEGHDFTFDDDAFDFGTEESISNFE